jgi:hypothetical protein
MSGLLSNYLCHKGYEFHDLHPELYRIFFFTFLYDICDWRWITTYDFKGHQNYARHGNYIHGMLFATIQGFTLYERLFL